MALQRLRSEYKQMIQDPNYLFSVCPDPKNFMIWNGILFGPPDTIFEGGLFKFKFTFGKDYPNKPPVFQFITSIPHPNIYPDGRICISILHEGNDEWGYEHISERWSPCQSANSILMSIISLLTDPNLESPANIDSAVKWRDNWDKYKEDIYLVVKNTQTNV
jgi:ubiquitin-conjugating enzyme E2 G1